MTLRDPLCTHGPIQLDLPFSGGARRWEDSLTGEGTLLPHVCRYINRRRSTGEVQKNTASNNWSSLMVLCKAHGNRPVTQLGQSTVVRWLQLRAHLKPSTRCTQWSMVSCFCQWLVDEGHLRTNPCATMTAPRRPRSIPRALPEADVAALLHIAPDVRGRAIVWLMVGLGLRCVEVHRLSVEDWARRDNLIRVVGKGHHEREVAVPAEARRALDAYLLAYPATSGPLIRSYTHSRSIRPGTLSHYLSDWMRLAGVKHTPYDGKSAHALRHTCASDVLDECGDLRIVQEMLGHQHLSSTSVYLRRAGVRRMLDAMEGRCYTGEQAPALAD